jgi:gliding motility-associated-like protein
VSIKVLSDVIPPKGFTPNGDGMFDKWDIPALLLYNNADIQIFDRWGGLVWEHSGAYEGNEWEGTNTKGKALPSGTYYYIIKYGDDTGTKTLTGPVTILR